MSTFIPDLFLSDYEGMSNLAADLRETFAGDMRRVSRRINCVTVKYGAFLQVKNTIESFHRDSLSDVFDIVYSSDDSSLTMVFHRKEAASVFIGFYEGSKREK